MSCFAAQLAQLGFTAPSQPTLDHLFPVPADWTLPSARPFLGERETHQHYRTESLTGFQPVNPYAG
jgi:hypothetical protein